MQCPKCKGENPTGADSCRYCTHDFGNAATMLPDASPAPDTYTPKFIQEGILTAKSAREGERKTVTVLFADAVGSTTIFGDLDPEDTHDIMDGCFRILGEIIEKYGGTINQYRGDGIMALFGAPVAYENHAHRACEAALEAQRALMGYDGYVQDRYGVGFKMRIGLNTGPVVVGAIGYDLRRDYTADGDTSNLASRLEGLAEPGAILVSDSVYDRVRPFFQFMPLGRKKIRGKPEPQPVYALTDKAAQPGAALDRMARSEMVGRESELDRLEAIGFKAKSGEGSIVNIVGEAGIGKSRLIAALKNRNTMAGIVLLEGRAINMGKNLSFYPIIGIIKSWAGIAERDTPQIALEKLRTAIDRICPEKGDEIFAFTAVMMGLKTQGSAAERIKGIEGEALAKLIMKNLADLVSSACKTTPIAFIIEDLHWADNSSVELLLSLLRLARNQKILFVNVFRPFYKDTGERLLAYVNEHFPDLHQEIYVQPLSRRDGSRLIDNLFNNNEVPVSLKEMVITRSEGNPFFIEEVVRSLIARGVVVEKSGRYRLEKPAESIVFPSTIRDIIVSRIDRLDESAKSLLKTASVIGRLFHKRVLERVTEPGISICDHLDYLENMQLITKCRHFDEIVYQFNHTLFQETVYDSILNKTKKRLHLKVAKSIESIYGERLNEFYGMLAYHYSQAESLKLAEKYMIKAGREALNASGSREALNYYREALEIYVSKYAMACEPGKIAMFEKNIALALYNSGQYGEAVDYFDKALAFFWGKTPTHTASAAVQFILGLCHFLVALYLPLFKFRAQPSDADREAIELYYKKCKALVIISPKRFFIESFYFYKKFTRFDYSKIENGAGKFISASSLFTFTGLSFNLGQKTLDAVAGKLDPADDRLLITHDLLSTQLRYFRGNWDDISDIDDALVNRNLDLGEIWSAAMHYYWHGFPSLFKGRRGVCLNVIERLDFIATIYGNDISRLLKYIFNTKFLVEYRLISEAGDEIEHGLEFIAKHDFTISIVDMYCCKASLALLRGDMDTASRCIQKADDILSRVTAVPNQLANFYNCQFNYLLCEQEFAAGSDGIDKGRKTLKAGKIAQKMAAHSAQHRTECHCLMGTYHWLRKDHDNAMKNWRHALSEAALIGNRLHLARCYLEIGKRLAEWTPRGKPVTHETSAQYIEKAHALFVEMNLSYDLEQLHRLRSRNDS